MFVDLKQFAIAVLVALDVKYVKISVPFEGTKMENLSHELLHQETKAIPLASGKLDLMKYAI